MDSRISATTSLYAFIGSPAHHSKSPIMHNLAFKELNIDSVYLAFDIKPEQLEDTIKSFKILKVQGSNVSMPHKEAIIPYLDEISTASRLCNAVNTIKLIDNHYYGTITDGIGFIKAINEQGWDIVNKKITIVGAGGACKAIMVQMALDGAREIIVYNRSKKDEFIKIINNTIKETNCKIEFKLLSDLEWKVLIAYLDGKSYQEIAVELHRHVKSIDNALQRVKRKLEKYVDGHGNIDIKGSMSDFGSVGKYLRDMY